MNAGIASSLVALAWALPALADNAPAGAPFQLEEIVITAQKRTERLEDIPVSASVINASSLTTANAGDISDLNRLVPSVQLNGTLNGRVPLGMRGISSVSNEGTVGISSGVAIMLDGVPVPSDSRAANALEDVQSIEVLKGPQATLGGRTAAAGVINIVTRRPSEVMTGNLSAAATSDHEYRVNGFISGPLAQAVDFSLAPYYTSREFPINNVQLGQHTVEKIYGVRGKLLFKPNEDLYILISSRFGRDDTYGGNLVYTHVTPGSYLLTGGGGPPFLAATALLPGISPSFSNVSYGSPVQGLSTLKDTEVSADIQYRLPGGSTLGSTTAYQREQQVNVQDLFAVAGYFWNALTGAPGSGVPPFYNIQTQHIDVKQFSEELKLASPTDKDLSYLVGVFYSDTKIPTTEDRALLPALINYTVIPDTKTTDLYGRTTWRFTHDDTLVTGLRFNHDQISYTEIENAYTISFPPPNIVGNLSATDSRSKSTAVGDISVQHKLAPDSMVYLTYARGYSPGAFNTSQALTPVNPTLGFEGNESIDHVELGSKGRYLDNRLTVNAALFHTKYKNFQVQIFDQSNLSLAPPLILSAAGAKTQGLEFDVDFAATDHLRLGLNAAYIDAKFTDYGAAPCYYPTTIAGLGFNPAGCFQRSAAGVVVSGPGQATLAGVPVVQNLSGKPLPNSPKVKISLNAEQRVPLGSYGDLVFNGNYSWRDKAQMLVDQNPFAMQGSFGILNLSAGFQAPAGRYSVTFFVNNLTNKVYYSDIEDFWSSPWGGTNNVVGQPARDAQRYFGVRFTTGF